MGSSIMPASPLFAQTPVFSAGEAGVCEYRIPALVCTNQGTLLAACDARVDKPGDAPNNIDLALKRSEDLGETWSEVQILVDDGGDMAAGDPCMLVDRVTGSVWIIYDHIYPTMDELLRRDPQRAEGAREEWHGRVIFVHAIRSDDDGRTWSDPIDLTPQIKHPDWVAAMAGPGMGITMSGGRLICPGYRRFDADLGEDSAHVYFSDDHGATWQVGEAAATQTNEAQAVELADGRLMLNMRTPRGYNRRRVAISQDGGETWSEAHDDPALTEPGCQASIIRWPGGTMGADGRLLFSNPASTDKRTDMTVRVSYDDGQTWPVAKTIAGEYCSYSCLAALPDGSAGILFEHRFPDPDAQGRENLVFARFNDVWLKLP
jgi:sialidase-1